MIVGDAEHVAAELRDQATRLAQVVSLFKLPLLEVPRTDMHR
ncbi:hypothetical protein [Paraburkholderia caffeinilytica]|nr:hypothetical protein [Paraburkholderia caffeinilytica]